MSSRGDYTQYALQQVDEKGRVAIPSQLRSVLLARNPAGLDPKEAATVMISYHPTDRCLLGFDLSYGEQRRQQLEQLAREKAGPGNLPDSAILRAGIPAETLAFDSSGRFILPAFPRKRARIDKYAFFIGQGSYFEIWDPAELVASPNSSELMREAVEFYLAERGESL